MAFGFSVDEIAIWYWDNFTDPVFGFAGQTEASGFNSFRLYTRVPSGYYSPAIWVGFNQDSFAEKVGVVDDYSALVDVYNGLDRLISQYKDATRLRDLIWERLDLAHKNVIEPLTQLEKMFSLDYAIGVWLDIIGDKIGFSRLWASWETYEDPMFGFDGQTEASGFDNNRFQTLNPDLYVRSGIGDELYRALLRGRGVTMWAPPTRPNLEFAVQRIFGDTIFTSVGEHGEEEYSQAVFGFHGQTEASGFDQNRLYTGLFNPNVLFYFGFGGQDTSSGFNQYGFYNAIPVPEQKRNVTIYVRGTYNQTLVDLLGDHKIASRVLPIPPKVDIYWNTKDIQWLTPEWYDAEEAAVVKDVGYNVPRLTPVFGFAGQIGAEGFDRHTMYSISGPIWEMWELYPVFGFDGQTASSGFDINRLFEIAERRNQ